MSMTRCAWPECSVRRYADRVEQGWPAVLARQVRRQQLRQQGELRLAHPRRGRRIPRPLPLPHLRDRGRTRLRVGRIYSKFTPPDRRCIYTQLDGRVGSRRTSGVNWLSNTRVLFIEISAPLPCLLSPSPRIRYAVLQLFVSCV